MKMRVGVLVGVLSLNIFDGAAQLPSLRQRCDALLNKAAQACDYVQRVDCLGPELSNQAARRQIPRWDQLNADQLTWVNASLQNVLPTLSDFLIQTEALTKIDFELISNCYLREFLSCSSMGSQTSQGIHQFLTAHQSYLGASLVPPQSLVPPATALELRRLLNQVVGRIEQSNHLAERTFESLMRREWVPEHSGVRNLPECREVANRLSDLSQTVQALTATSLLAGLNPPTRRTILNHSAPVMTSCSESVQAEATGQYLGMLQAARAASIAEMHRDANRSELAAAQAVEEIAGAILLAGLFPIRFAAAPALEAVQRAPTLRVLEGGLSRAATPTTRVATRTGAVIATTARDLAAQPVPAQGAEVVLQLPNGDLVARDVRGANCQIPRERFCRGIVGRRFDVRLVCGP